MQLSIFYFKQRKLTCNDSRFLFALSRFARDSRFGFPFRFLALRFRSTLSNKSWWAQMDSDHRPHAYQACALTS